MKCEFCKQEFSDKVLPLHMNVCGDKPKQEATELKDTTQETPPTLTEYEQLKQEATELGLEYKHNISKAALTELIEEAKK